MKNLLCNKLILLAFFLIIFGGISCKKDSKNTSQNSGPNIGKIKGQVGDGWDNDPSDKTVLFYLNSDTISKQLDNIGNFLFENIAVGTYTIMVKGVESTKTSIEVKKKTRTEIYFSYEYTGTTWNGIPIMNWKVYGPDYIME